MNNSITKFTYQRVADAIADMCSKGEVAVGAKLPSAHELADRFNCNYHTIRKGIEQLTSAGILETRPGAGCFVKSSTRTISAPDRGNAHSVVTAICRPPNSTNDMRCISALHAKCEEKGYYFELQTVSNFQNPQELVDRIILRGCAMLLFPMLRANDNLSAVRRALENRPVPIVIGSPLPGLEQYCYESPLVFGLSVYLSIMTEFIYFHKLGFKQIKLLINGNNAYHSIADVIQAYSRACAEFQILSDIAQVFDLQGSFEKLICQWEPDRGNLAVIVYSEEMALKLALAARAHGWEIPRDLALIGWGDTGLCEEFSPTISAMSFPFEYLAEALLAKSKLPPGKFVRDMEPIHHEFILRSSCGGIDRIGREKALDLIRNIEKEVCEKRLPELLKERKRTLK